MSSLEFRKKYFGTDKEKIVLLGSAPSSVSLAPYGNPDWYKMGCSPGMWGHLMTHNLPVDAWVEIHRVEVGQPWMSVEYYDWITKFSGPVFMAEVRKEVPTSCVFPIAELIAKYSPYFFSSSLAYMMAMAIEAGFKKIMLAGVDMSAPSEYGLQKPALWFFGMLAKARGVEVGVPPESDLFRPMPLYGISEVSHPRIKIMARRRELQARVATAQQQQHNAEREILFLQGALDDLEWCEMTWTGNVDGVGSSFVEPPHAAMLCDLADSKSMPTLTDAEVQSIVDAAVSNLQDESPG